MTFKVFAQYLQQIEETSSRNEMTEILAEMFGEAGPKEAKLMAYLSLGQLGPQYNNPEFGISTKLMYQVLARAYNREEDDIQALYKKEGDLGSVAQVLGSKKRETRNGKRETGNEGLSVGDVYSWLLRVAQEEGEGSQERKLDGLSKLLKQLGPVSAKYVTRIPIGKLRLGFSDVTILDALSWMEVESKDRREEIERAYNVSANIGKIVRQVKEFGIDSLKDITIEPGTPIRMAAAERLPTAEAIIEKIGKVAAEPKIDGLRLQCHFVANSKFEIRNSKQISNSNEQNPKHKSGVILFSRNLDDMTKMFPEIVEAVDRLKVDSIIFEGEAVAYNPDTEEFLPFQETMRRRRKYNIEEKAAELPLKLFAFDLLYLNGENFLNKPYQKRRAKLAELITASEDTLNIIEEDTYKTTKDLQSFFLEQIEHGLEGIMAKRLDAPYTPGARNNNWVKLKREEKSELDDSLDCLVLGYKLGTGKRAEFGIGAFLVGVYDEDEDVFKTISNVGTGLTDEQWREMRARADALSVKSKPARYDVPKELEQDVWISPAMVVEILADEITRSPLHTAGKVDDKPGYALRFPRLIKWRDDKNPQQATSVAEIKTLSRG